MKKHKQLHNFRIRGNLKTNNNSFRRLHDRKTEHFKALTQIGHASAVTEHSISTGPNIKWDHFEILANGQCDLQCKIKETLLIRNLKPALNENVGSENILLY